MARIGGSPSSLEDDHLAIDALILEKTKEKITARGKLREKGAIEALPKSTVEDAPILEKTEGKTRVRGNLLEKGPIEALPMSTTKVVKGEEKKAAKGIMAWVIRLVHRNLLHPPSKRDLNPLLEGSGVSLQIHVKHVQQVEEFHAAVLGQEPLAT